ncbi:MAG: lamin tail domain-containing protein [Anaerolineales bacterium]|nr:lamin tail domain-containing protein [Anaerolineales bacterium]
MNQAKKLLFYIVINIIVSAVTIIAVLYLWENTRLKNVLFNSPDTPAAASDPNSSQVEVDEPSNLQIEIGEVGGVGNLATEYVLLTRPGSDAADTISLQNWSIKDENNNVYVILEQSGVANLDLHGQGAVNIYTKAGDSNPIELYLGLSDPIWEPGETVTLIDPNGEVHDTYLIP